MSIHNYMYNYTAQEDFERLFKPLLDSLMSFVYVLITIIAIVVIIYIAFYLYSSIVSRRRMMGIRTTIDVVRDSVTSLNMIGDYIVVKTKRNSIHTFSDPVTISIREIKPYTSLGGALIAVGLLFFITPRVLEILNIDISYLPVSTFLSLLVLIALLFSGILLLMIKNYSLYIETKTGSKTIFTSIRMNLAEAELVIYKYLENKQKKLNVEEEKKESEQASRVENK